MKEYNYKMIRILNQKLESRSTLKYPFLGKHLISPEIHACTRKLLVGFLHLSMCFDTNQVLYIVTSAYFIVFVYHICAESGEIYDEHNSNNNL